jgi:hypothetical protein
MQKYARLHGAKYQDLTLLHSEEETNAFSEEFLSAVEAVCRIDKSLSQTVGRAYRLFELLRRYGLLARVLFLPAGTYADFMQRTTSPEEARHDRLYRKLLRTTRSRGFVPGSRLPQRTKLLLQLRRADRLMPHP